MKARVSEARDVRVVAPLSAEQDVEVLSSKRSEEPLKTWFQE